jgi:hypothetical protein
MRFAAILAVTLISLTACKGVEPVAEYPDPDRERIYRYGSLASEEGGFSLLKGQRDRGEEENTGLGVNSFLWRATLDTLSFMPLASADPFGGVVMTDWYTDPAVASERTKVQAMITSRELKADGVKTSIFRQVSDGRGGWKDAPVAADSAQKLEDAILTRARQIRQSAVN